MITRQNVVPSNAPRKALVQNGILYRFGFEEIAGSGLSKVGEVLCRDVPPVDILRAAQQEYCRTHGVDEPFNPADYGYGTTTEE